MSGGIETASTPIVVAQRSKDFLCELADEEFCEVYNNVKLPDALRFNFMSKGEFQRFAKLHVPGLRSVMEHQVLRWILPSPKVAKSRYAPKDYLALILKTDFFEKKHFDNPGLAASNLISLVAKFVFENVRSFAPKLRPSFDSYPAVLVKDPTTDKLRETESEYFKRFVTNWAWFSLAKTVARYTHHGFKATFMEPFNDPGFQVSQVFPIHRCTLTRRSVSLWRTRLYLRMSSTVLSRLLHTEKSSAIPFYIRTPPSFSS